MSSDGHHEHVPGAAEPRELSHPLLWTVGLLVSVAALGFVFFHFKDLGKQHAKGEPVWALPTAEVGPDHAALIDDKSQAVLDKGEIIYSKNCASCHGPNGDTNPSNINPKPRNFHADPLKAKWGSGPYGIFMTLSEGYGASMPAFANLMPADRYAVAHFIRETWMKPNAEATHYTEKDADEIAKLIPAAGESGDGAAVAVDPLAVKPPATALPLMATVAAADQGNRQRLGQWLSDAGIDTGAELQPAFNRLRALFSTQNARIANLFATAKAQDKAAFTAVLVGEDGAGSADPYFSLLGQDTLQKLYARLAETATRTN